MKEPLILAIIALFISTLTLFAVNYSKEPIPTTTFMESPVKPAIHVETTKHWSSTYIRGYNDGYDANWLAPINWTLSGDYRSGWSAGERDRKKEKPNKFEQTRAGPPTNADSPAER